jgi:hypothetical protein
VEEFKYLGTSLMNLTSLEEEFRSRLKSGNTCYHLVQNLLSSSCINEKIQTYRNLLLPVVVYECVFWSLMLREECRLRVFVNRVLGRIFGPKVDAVTGVERTA